LSGQSIPEHVLHALKRFISDQYQATLRAKKAAACLLWISEMAMSNIEKMLTQFGGAFDGAAGPVRAVASRTCDLLPAVVRIATILHPGLELTDRFEKLLTRLEVGVHAGVVEIARHLVQGSREETTSNLSKQRSPQSKPLRLQLMKNSTPALGAIVTR
jgi:helicase